MINFVNKIIQSFSNFKKYNKTDEQALLYDIKKFVIPILHCELLVDATIDVEDKYLEYIDPVNFYKFSLLQNGFGYAKALLKNVVDDINKIFKEAGYEFQYYYRVKSAYSIMHRTLDKKGFILDKFGIRIIFNTIYENYYQFAWGIVENLSNNFNVLKVTDYLSHPRETGYSASHVLLAVENILIEVQIIYLADAITKVPHFKYKQYVSQNNLYIERDAKTAVDKINQDLINYSKCHFLKK